MSSTFGTKGDDTIRSSDEVSAADTVGRLLRLADEDRATATKAVAALGVDLVGEDVGLPEDRIEPWILLSGGAVLPAPVTLNRETPAGPRTAGVVRYAPLVDDGGHYVTFQQEGPKHQYGCFLQTLYETGSPVLVAPGGESDPCD